MSDVGSSSASTKLPPPKRTYKKPQHGLIMTSSGKDTLITSPLRLSFEPGSPSPSPSSSSASTKPLSKMDPELRCPTCSRFFLNPVLLPCGHSLCTSCAVTALRPNSDSSVSAAIQSAISRCEGQSRPSTTFEPNLEGSSSTVSGNSHVTDSDQQSVVSETDSGVVMSSRAGVYLGRPPTIFCSSVLGFTQITKPAVLPPVVIQNLSFGLPCPLCRRIVALLDEKGVNQLPRNGALERVLTKLVGIDRMWTISHQADPARHIVPICQLCDEPDPLNMDPLSIGGARMGETGSGTPASVWCEQCGIFYCEECRERCHPSRGPLLKHSLHTADRGAEIVQKKRHSNPPVCPEHPHQSASLFCVACRIAVCAECVLDDPTQTVCTRTLNEHGLHAGQEVQPLQTYCKTKKTELSQVLQALSEKARAGTQHIQRLRSICEVVLKSAKRSEEDAAAKFDCLIQSIEAKKSELVSAIREEREAKQRILKDQIQQCTARLTRSTGLIQFCIEMLKESDAQAFLLVSQSLIHRVLSAEQAFLKTLETPSIATHTSRTLVSQSHPSTPSHWFKTGNGGGTEGPRTPSAHSSFVSLMQLETLQKAVSELTLHEGIDDQVIDCSASSVSSDCDAPTAPIFRAEECLSEGNIITVVWQPCSGFGNDYYTLEIDDGAGGAFRKVYRGIEPMCTIEGLHFHSIYRARVKAHNQSGYSAYSDHLVIQTSMYSWFHMDVTRASSSGIQFSNSNRSVTCASIEDSVVLATTGLSRGVHYWEFIVDRLDAGGQPAFGIAKSDCDKEAMLGHDARAWAMYIDRKRSWFLHKGEHFERTDGGIRVGSVLGVRLDCDRGSLSYYLDDEPHGPIAFSQLPAGVYYPAISLNRAVQLTLRCGLEPPSESESDSNGSDCSSGGRGGGVGDGREDVSKATGWITQSVLSGPVSAVSKPATSQ